MRASSYSDFSRTSMSTAPPFARASLVALGLTSELSDIGGSIDVVPRRATRVQAPIEPARLVTVSTVAAPAVVDSPWLNAQRQFDNAAEILQSLTGVARGPARRSPRARRALSREDGRRQRSHVRGIPRSAQRDARPRQGGPPVPPGDRHRRGESARDVDDLEVRAREPPLRRRQGRCCRRPVDPQPPRARAAHPEVRGGDQRAGRDRSRTSPPRTSTRPPRSWPGSWTHSRCRRATPSPHR